MSSKNKQEKRDAEKKKQEAAKAEEKVPAFRDEAGELVKLKKADFPGGRDGKKAFCDYMIVVYQQRKLDLDQKTETKKTLQTKLDAANARIAELQADLKK